MKFCANCGSKLEEGKPFCWNCGTQVIVGENTAGSHSTDTHESDTDISSPHDTTHESDVDIPSPRATSKHSKHSKHSAGPRSPAPSSFGQSSAVGHSMPSFFSSFLSSPSKAIQDEYVSPGVAAIILILSPLSTFLLTYATSWRAATDLSRMIVDLNWSAAFGATVLHTLIAFFILLATVYLVMKIRGHNDNVDTGLFFSLAACITIVSTAYTIVTSLVMFVSSSWGGFMAGLVTISIRGHTETMPPMPHNSIMLSAVSALLLFLVVKRVFRSSTEDTICAIAVASIANWTYQAFGVERIFYALYN